MTATTITEATEVTPEFYAACKAALRSYDSYLNVRATYTDAGYTGTVTLGDRIKMEGCDPPYVTKYVECPASAVVERYGDAAKVPGCEIYSAATSHYLSDHLSALRTLVSLCRPGDHLKIIFRLNNDSDNLREAGLHHDQVYLVVARKNKIVGDILIDDTVAPRSYYGYKANGRDC